MSRETLETQRLLLRRWSAADREPFARMNADPRVMEHFPSVLTRAESDAFMERITAHFHLHGFGLWAVEVKSDSSLAGFVGLLVPSFEAHFTPCVEVGWRLAAERQGQGFASEAAQEVVRWGFVERGLAEIVSMTVPANVKSRHVMEKLGMQRRETDDFDHPRLPEGHPLRRHVLYRLTRHAWDGNRAR